MPGQALTGAARALRIVCRYVGPAAIAWELLSGLQVVFRGPDALH